MKKKFFKEKILELSKELKKYGIEVYVDEEIDPEKLRCEWYKNKEKDTLIWFAKGCYILCLKESGTLNCWDKNGKKYNSDFGGTFETVYPQIHNDDELTDAIEYENNNWFEIIVYSLKKTHGVSDSIYFSDDVCYSISSILNCSYIVEIFEKAQKWFMLMNN